MNLFKYFSIFILCFLLILTSCNNDDDRPGADNETITRVIITLDDRSNPPVTYTYEPGVTDVDNLTINAVHGVTYDVNIEFFNGIESINPEVIEEADDHFIVYTSTISDLTFTRAVDDITRTTGERIGIKTTWTFASATTDSETVGFDLIHEADSVNDTANGELGSAEGGSSDANGLITVVIS